MLLDLRHEVVTLLVVDLAPPTKVVEAVVAILQLATILDAAHTAHLIHEVDRHVADVDNAAVGAQHAAGLGDDSCGVGVVEHPGVGAVLLHVVENLDDAADGAHAVGDTAGTAGLLANAAVLERNLLIELTHGVQADADVSKDEVGPGECGLGVGGVAKLNLGGVLVEVDLAGLGHGLLALGVVVVEGHLVDREAVALLEQHQGNARGKGGATTGNGHGIVLLGHDVLLILAACSIRPRTRPCAVWNCYLEVEFFISRIGLAVHTGSARPIVSMDNGLQKTLVLQKTLELLANLRDAKADDDLD